MKTQQDKAANFVADEGEASRKGPPRKTLKSPGVCCSWLGIYLVLLLALSLVAQKARVPYEAIALMPAGGGFASAVHLLLGRPGGTDFLCDYASAHALWHHRDAYESTARLTERIDALWAVSTANLTP